MGGAGAAGSFPREKNFIAAAGEGRKEGRGVRGGGGGAEEGVEGRGRWRGVAADRAEGEAKERERALRGESPAKEGLAAAVAGGGGAAAGEGSVRVRYQGLRESKRETVKEKREEVEPPPPPILVDAAAEETVDGSKRREVVPGRWWSAAANGRCSSSESSKSRDHTTAVDVQRSTNGREPCAGEGEEEHSDYDQHKEISSGK